MNRVKIEAYKKLCSIALENNGIIFGGFVRDQIIAGHYSDLYYEHHKKNNLSLNESKFWNDNYMPETKKRLLIPDDIDISFSDEADINKFIYCVKNIKEFNSVSVTAILDNSYNLPIINYMRRMYIMINVGAIPFITEGISVIIIADIILPKTSFVEPPFRNLDMLCNGFIIKNNEITFSKYTGTLIDNMSPVKRANIISKIMNDLINCKTIACFCNCGISKSLLNVRALNRINKLYEKNMGWKVLNLPFNIKKISSKYPKNNYKEECMICLSEIKKKQLVSYMSVTSSNGELINCAKIHYQCFMENLASQSAAIIEDNLNKVTVFKCPLRNEIDFSKCNKNLEYIL